MGIKELNRKGEGLIETGRNLEQRIVDLQNEININTERLSYAYEALADAQQVDDDGNSKGDVSAARMQLEMLREQIRRAEIEQVKCKEEIQEVNNKKKEVIFDINRITKAEESNVEKLRALQSKMMSKNAAAMISAIIARMNEGAETVEQLQVSMGMNGNAKQYSEMITMRPIEGSYIIDEIKPEPTKPQLANTHSDEMFQNGNFPFRLLDKKQNESYFEYRRRATLISNSSENEFVKNELLRNNEELFHEYATKMGWIKPCSGNVAINGIRFPDNYCATKEYGEILLSRIDAAEEVALEAINTFSDKLAVVDDGFNIYGAPAHYSPQFGFSDYSKQYQEPAFFYEDQGVHYNSIEDQHNPRGAGTTFFHEIGHMIDHSANGFADQYLSDDLEFRQALIADGEEIETIYKEMPRDEKDRFDMYMHSDSYHSVEDLINGLSWGRIEVNWHHPIEYWQKNPGVIYKEAFAHFFEASCGEDAKKKKMEFYFPRSYRRFCEILHGAAVEQHRKKKVLKK